MKKFLEIVSSKKAITIISFFGLFLISVGVSVLVFSYFLKNPTTTSATLFGKSRVDLGQPKTQACPINGMMYTKDEEKIWQERRPIAVMIENHVDSRPASGLSRADVVYEAVAEGGITRFLSIFYCGGAAEDVQIAPVRSARVYFINFAAEYGDNPIFMHVGGANNYSGSGDTAKDARALELLESIGWRVPEGNDFDTTYDSGYPIFWRNYERLGHPIATEHTMMASLDAAYEQAAKRGFAAKDLDGVAWDENFIRWNFENDKPDSGPTATDISFGFWDGKPEYNVEWKYDSNNNQYLRFNGGNEHIDFTTKKQLTAKDVVIFFARERGPVDRNHHMLYTVEGKGKALVFKNGDVISGTWEKDSLSSRTRFFDERGKEISFVRGPIWIEVVPAGNAVNY